MCCYCSIEIRRQVNDDRDRAARLRYQMHKQLLNTFVLEMIKLGLPI